MNGKVFLHVDGEERKHLNLLERKRFLKVVRSLEPMHDRTFCMALFFTGCRISEALELTPKRVDIAEGMLIFRTLKQRGSLTFRRLPVPEDYMEELQEHIKNSGYSDTDRLWRLSRTTAWSRIKACMKNTGIQGIKATPKGLRHGFAVGCVDAGTPLSILQYWMGHKRIETTMIYLQMSNKEKQKWAQKNWDMLL